MVNLFDYLTATYKPNEPIFLSDLQLSQLTNINIRQQLKELTESRKIKRFDDDIYFIPKQTIFKSGSALNPEKVLEAIYMKQNGERCGYLSGLLFCNHLRLTTQVPAVYEVVSNKAAADYKVTALSKSKIIIRKPKAPVTEENYKVLQFLDLMEDIDLYAELSGKQLQNCLHIYMEDNQLKLLDMKPYFAYYPDKLYRNLVETGVIYF